MVDNEFRANRKLNATRAIRDSSFGVPPLLLSTKWARETRRDFNGHENQDIIRDASIGARYTLAGRFISVPCRTPLRNEYGDGFVENRCPFDAI